MNENNSMAYTQNKDAQSDILQNPSVYAQDTLPPIQENSLTTAQDSTTQDSTYSMPDNTVQGTMNAEQDNVAQSSMVSLQKENAFSEPVQNKPAYPQENSVQDSYPQSNPTYTQNAAVQGNSAYSQNAAAQGNPVYTQNTAAQNTSAYTQNAAVHSNPAYAQNSTMQGNPAPAMTYSNTPLLQLNDLCKRYPGMGTYMSVFHMNLIIPRGRIIGLLGPNGCGKTTLIKMINGLLAPTCGNVLINGMEPGPATKKVISYLPERTYLDNGMKVSQMVTYFADFYEDFSTEKAYGMLGALGISSDARLKTLSKGTKEKVQLILVMSRQADLYILDEPIAGVDPAARDYILRTIITNYNPGSTIILSTHLISDIENILDDVIFMKNGSLMLYTSVDSIRSQMGKSVDTYFREVYAC